MSRSHRRWIYASFGLLYGSGLAWLILRQWFTDPERFGAGVHPLQPFCMRMHGAAAMCYLLVLGTLLPIHVKRWWEAGMNRRSGAVVLGFNLLLIVSGYALYYLSNENRRAYSSSVHIWLGVIAPVFLLVHVISGRKTIQRRRRAT